MKKLLCLIFAVSVIFGGVVNYFIQHCIDENISVQMYECETLHTQELTAQDNLCSMDICCVSFAFLHYETSKFMAEFKHAKFHYINPQFSTTKLQIYKPPKFS